MENECLFYSMKRLLAVFLLASLSSYAQLRNDVEDSLRQEPRAVVPEFSLRQQITSRNLTHREYAQLIQNYVSQPQPEPGTFGIGVVYQGDGEWRVCERAPEPSSLSLLLVGGAVLMAARRRLG